MDDLNIIGTPEDNEEASSYVMSEFEMKDLGKTKFCPGLQLEHSPDGILVISPVGLHPEGVGKIWIW